MLKPLSEPCVWLVHQLRFPFDIKDVQQGKLFTRQPNTINFAFLAWVR